MEISIARIQGDAGIAGTVRFWQRCTGVLVTADILGLPESVSGFFAFHIHEGTGCGGEGYGDTKGHYNPEMMEHPRHAGDLPPLLNCRGRAYMQVLTDRFQLSDVIGRTVVIHEGSDDFTSQPAGNAGKKIACGVILPA